jgi:hypothetical protein
MFLESFPLVCVFCVLRRAESGISSSRWASSAVEDSELESAAEAPTGGFFAPVNFNLHLDFPFSLDVTRGTVRGVCMEVASSAAACRRKTGESREKGGGSVRKLESKWAKAGSVSSKAFFFESPDTSWREGSLRRGTDG